jgi:hypothetical protein
MQYRACERPLVLLHYSWKTPLIALPAIGKTQALPPHFIEPERGGFAFYLPRIPLKYPRVKEELVYQVPAIPFAVCYLASQLVKAMPLGDYATLARFGGCGHARRSAHQS